MPLDDGERQVAPDLSGIRRDHVARYEFAAAQISPFPPRRIIDVACGIGYGTAILADAGHDVLGLDKDAEAIEYGRQHYARENARRRCADVSHLPAYEAGSFDVAICFEAIEHLADPLPMLRDLARLAPTLIASVPNEDRYPYRGQSYHHRHYTPAEFEALLNQAGFEVTSWWGQEGPFSEVERDRSGRTVIAIARRAAEPKPNPGPASAGRRLDHVVILGLGPSLEHYVDTVKRLGSRRRFADEVWAINALGDILQADRIFHMDDVRIQEIRAAARPQSNIAAMLEWLKRHPGPVYTSQTHPGYPGLVAFPLEEVVNGLGYSYFNSTAAYAIAYAIHLEVKKISLFGVDFTYPRAHDAEKGRACCEFWLGIAASRGIEIAIAERSTLMDMIDGEKLYGYDAVDVAIEQSAPGQPARVVFTPRDRLPTADEIERAYDHSRHPNAAVRN